MATPSDPTESAGSAAGKRLAIRLDRWREHYREAGLAVILGLQATNIFVLGPLAGVPSLFSTEGIEALRFALAATAILIVTRSRLIGWGVGVTFVVSLAGLIYLRSGPASQATHVAIILLILAFDLAVASTVAHAAFDAGRVTVYRILGAVILYLYVGLIFASLYRLAAMFLPQAFAGLSRTRTGYLGDLLYFSLSTLTTSGYGDIHPVHPFVRSMANLEAVIGQLYPATLLARLVTLHGTVTERRPRKR